MKSTYPIETNQGGEPWRFQSVQHVNELSGIESIACSVTDAGINAILQKLCDGIRFCGGRGLQPRVAVRKQPRVYPFHMILTRSMLTREAVEQCLTAIGFPFFLCCSLNAIIDGTGQWEIKLILSLARYLVILKTLYKLEWQKPLPKCNK